MEEIYNQEPPDPPPTASGTGFSYVQLYEENTPAENSQDRNFFVNSPLPATSDIPLDKIIGLPNPKRSLEQDSGDTGTAPGSPTGPTTTKKPHRDFYGTDEDEDIQDENRTETQEDRDGKYKVLQIDTVNTNRSSPDIEDLLNSFMTPTPVTENRQLEENEMRDQTGEDFGDLLSLAEPSPICLLYTSDAADE